MKYLFRFLKSPTLHFLLIGALLFSAHRVWEKYSGIHTPIAKEELIIGKDQIEQIKSDIFTQTGLPATPAQVEAGIQKAIEDEVLYRQALALHLDRYNPSIRHRLIQLGKFVSPDPKVPDTIHYQKALELGLDRSDLVIRRYLISSMQLVAKKVPTPGAPSEVTLKELQDYLAHHSQSFLTPQQFKISQIYISRDKHHEQALAMAKELRKKILSEKITHDQIANWGDPFLHGNHFPWLNESALARLFGATLIQNLIRQPPGTWSAPLLSSYGWHLVYVEGIRPPQTPPLEEVANQVKSAVFREREQQRLSDTLQNLRSQYVIRVEGGTSDAQGST